MAVPTAKGRTEKHLQIAFLGIIFSLLTACGSTKMTPQYVQEEATALAVDSLVPADAGVLATIAPYKEKLNARLDSIVGYSAQELQKQTVESGLGNFVADLMLEAAQDSLKIPIDLGVVTIGGLRMALPEGPIRLKDIYEVMPFENLILVLQLTGPQTQQLFDFAAERGIVAIANSKMVVRDGKPVSILIDGKPLDLSRNYTVATSDYLASGGDNMEMLKAGRVVKNTEILLRAAILNKISALHQQGKKIEAGLEGRVEVVE